MKPYDVHFHQNARSLIDRVSRYFLGGRPSEQALNEVKHWFSCCRPVHRLSVATFEKVLKMRMLCSQHYLQTRKRDSKIILQLPSILKALTKFPQLTAFITELVESVILRFQCKETQRKKGNIFIPQVPQVPQLARNALGGHEAEMQEHEHSINKRVHVLSAQARGGRFLERISRT